MYNNNNGGQPAQTDGGRARAPRINFFEGEGIIKSRSANDGDQIKFWPFPSGGGAIHFSLMVTESYTDKSGAPRTKNTYIPMSARTNNAKKNPITAQMLTSIRPGMRARVAGRIVMESYTSKKSGEQQTSLVVDVFNLQVLDFVQQAPAPYGMPQPGMQQPQYGGYPAPAPVPGQYGYMPQQSMQQPVYGGYPQAPAPQAPLQQPPFPAYQGVAPAGPAAAPGMQQPPFPPAARPAPAATPYYQPGAQAQNAEDDNDLPRG